MEYEIVIDRSAAKYLGTQDETTRKRILQAMEGLRRDPPEGDIKKMQGTIGLYRLRVGTYRVLFSIDKNERVVYVDLIGPRGNIYKK